MVTSSPKPGSKNHAKPSQRLDQVSSQRVNRPKTFSVDPHGIRFISWFLVIVLTVIVWSISLNLVRLSSEAGLNPIFGSIASSYYSSQAITVIDLIIVPVLVNLFGSQLPDLWSTALLGSILVWRCPDSYGRLMIGQSSKLGDPRLGSILFQSLAHWPTRILTSASTLACLNEFFKIQTDAQPFSLAKKTFILPSVRLAILPLILSALSHLVLPIAQKPFDLVGPCEVFKVTSAALFLVSGLGVALWILSLSSKPRKNGLASWLLVVLSILAWLFLPPIKSFCQEPPKGSINFRPGPNSTGSYKLLARRSSLTGLILVGELQPAGEGSELRFLRCDHSLLGGIWIGPARRAVRARLAKDHLSSLTSGEELEIQATREAESIYSTFNLQEAIRLSIRSQEGKIDPNIRDRALVIGLGIGTSTRSLIRHGVEVTIVEIDPLVYNYAQKFFELPTPDGGVFLEDARQYLQRETQNSNLFDYIIHDVFTGGSVPASLFTTECWRDVRARLKEDGVLAVNFAGKPLTEAGALVLTTLFDVFPHCRAFAEKTEDPTTENDFQNMVIFCSPRGPPNFRAPNESDVFGSVHRFKILQEFGQLEFKLNRLLPSRNSSNILKDRNSVRLERAQIQSSLHHWAVMRQVLPDYVWELYY
ncbi:hypothetical protein PPACK8108_LOCUS4195 [Phakopsora pachyrhizi]|uniref:PABS domain-containing protein n=1 Tax=Phakopsora pachyrhizi TaxID=170000 RepID=A0AAV0AMT7_PHAPC|nr:hypothetical protein PPACK8108_LOCUS4195 [Phakopsora pachyrhizi]